MIFIEASKKTYCLYLQRQLNEDICMCKYSRSKAHTSHSRPSVPSRMITCRMKERFFQADNVKKKLPSPAKH